MITITEDYVSFEIAKLLKERGFDRRCRAYYASAGSFSYEKYEVESSECEMHNVILAPTLQMAMKWLREVHNIAIDTEWEHLWYAYVKPMTANPFEDDYHQCFSRKYEEAVEEAIKYCLENLI